MNVSSRRFSRTFLSLSRRSRQRVLSVFCHSRDTKGRETLKSRSAVGQSVSSNEIKNSGFATISRNTLVYYGNARPSLSAILLPVYPSESSPRLCPLNTVLSPSTKLLTFPSFSGFLLISLQRCVPPPVSRLSPPFSLVFSRSSFVFLASPSLLFLLPRLLRHPALSVSSTRPGSSGNKKR